MEEKILLGIATYDRKRYCLDEFIKSLIKIRTTYRKKIDIIFIDNSKNKEHSNYIRGRGFEVIRAANEIENLHERLTSVYNVLRSIFLKGTYTHLFVLEQDIFPPKDVIQRLLDHEKEIISGVFWIKDNPCVMIDKGYMAESERKGKGPEFNLKNRIFKYDFIETERLNESEPIKVFACGLGCVLMKRTVMQKVKFRVIKNLYNQWKGHNDMFFYFDLKERKIPVYIDPTVKCRHDNDTY